MADKSQGLITLLRDIKKHWLWKFKPFSKGQAWVDLLLLANHKNEKILFEGKVIEIKRGQFITSQLKLADNWGWSRQQVRTFLQLLEYPNPDLPMITCQNLTNRATIITILNYSELQKLPTKLTTNQQPTSNQPATINKNDNNNNNIYMSNKFKEIYMKYPKKVGRKGAERNFRASVKTEQDWLNINKALENYLKSERVAKGIVQDAKTWFNNWQDWIDYTEPFCLKCKGVGRFVSPTGYENFCNCPAGVRLKIERGGKL